MQMPGGRYSAVVVVVVVVEVALDFKRIERDCLEMSAISTIARRNCSRLSPSRKSRGESASCQLARPSASRDTQPNNLDAQLAGFVHCHVGVVAVVAVAAVDKDELRVEAPLNFRLAIFSKALKSRAARKAGCAPSRLPAIDFLGGEQTGAASRLSSRLFCFSFCVCRCDETETERETQTQTQTQTATTTNKQQSPPLACLRLARGDRTQSLINNNARKPPRQVVADLLLFLCSLA